MDEVVYLQPKLVLEITFHDKQDRVQYIFSCFCWVENFNICILLACFACIFSLSCRKFNFLPRTSTGHSWKGNECVFQGRIIVGGWSTCEQKTKLLRLCKSSLVMVWLRKDQNLQNVEWMFSNKLTTVLGRMVVPLNIRKKWRNYENDVSTGWYQPS